MKIRAKQEHRILSTYRHAKRVQRMITREAQLSNKMPSHTITPAERYCLAVWGRGLIVR